VHQDNLVEEFSSSSKRKEVAEGSLDDHMKEEECIYLLTLIDG